MSDITCAETATLLSEVSPLGCRAPWEREMAKLALLNRIADGTGTAAANAASYSVTRSVAASGAILTTDSIILADSTAGAVTITLPPAATANGRVFVVKRVNAGANNVTVDPFGSETIDGAATNVLSTQWAYVRFVSNGTAWFIV